MSPVRQIMSKSNHVKLGETLWSIVDQLRGDMNADDLRDYLLSFLFLCYLSDNYEQAAKKELGRDYPDPSAIDNGVPPLANWYANNLDNISTFEKQMQLKAHYVIRPEHLWTRITHLARTQNSDLLNTLQAVFKHIENESFQSAFSGLFSEVNLGSEMLGKTYEDRNVKLCAIISKIAEGLDDFSTETDSLGDAYEYLIGQFAASSLKKTGEFYTPQSISDILSAIVTLDGQEPMTGRRKHLAGVLDFACGTGSLLINVRKCMGGSHGIGKIHGQEKNIATCNLARMNMLLHGVKSTEFEIHHGDTLTNDWDLLRETNPAKKPYYDAVAANPPFSSHWTLSEALGEDMRFKDYGLAPKSTAEFLFLLHGFHYLKDDGVMAIILPHRVLFRGGAEAKIRRKLLEDGYIDTVIGLPGHLLYSTGIPFCILVLKKCRKSDDVLFINASEHFEKGNRQNHLSDEHVKKIIDTYQQRPESVERYSRCVEMKEFKANDFNLNISRYVNMAKPEVAVDLSTTHNELAEIERRVRESTAKHSAFLNELGLPSLPASD